MRFLIVIRGERRALIEQHGVEIEDGPFALTEGETQWTVRARLGVMTAWYCEQAMSPYPDGTLLYFRGLGGDTNTSEPSQQQL